MQSKHLRKLQNWSQLRNCVHEIAQESKEWLRVLQNANGHQQAQFYPPRIFQYLIDKFQRKTTVEHVEKVLNTAQKKNLLQLPQMDHAEGQTLVYA